MKLACSLLFSAMNGPALSPASAGSHPERIQTVAETQGLVAFWDFDHVENGVWTSHHHPARSDRSYPLRLRRIGDPKSYAPAEWPYDDEDSRLEVLREGQWERVGTEIVTRVREGAPFTFDRALGLGSEKLEEGSQLFLDGVAVFDRVLAERELRMLSFPEEDG